jgi:chromosomal replication initiator protein
MPAKGTFSWEALLTAVRADYPELYRTWFETLPAGTLDAGELRVVVDDPARLRFLRDSCSAAFVQATMALTGHLIAVRFTSGQQRAEAPLASSAPPPITHTPLNPDYTLDQFVVGPSNRLSHAAARAVCDQLGTLYNPLFIHGASGLGKTHLLQAVCADLRRRDPTAKALYVCCESFVNYFVRAIETGLISQFRESARGVSALIIDDVQFLAQRESTQEELFHTFNALHQSGQQIILSADSPPAEIPSLEERLVSRFSWGLVTQIDRPNRETRQAILHKKARLRGYEVPDELLDFIAARVQSNVRVLEGALTKLISETHIGGKPMSLDTVTDLLGEFDGRPARLLRVSDILETVSKHFGLRRRDLVSRKRSRSISHPRQIGMYLARKLTPLSLQEIGAHFGGRDHSTVLHAERVIDSTRLKDPKTADTLTQLTSTLLARR